MALGHDLIYLLMRIILVLVLILEVFGKKTQTYYMDGVDCNDVKYIGGATVYSHRPEVDYYPNNNECTMSFKAENKQWKIMLQVLELDIPDVMPYHNLCNDALYVYDADKVVTAMKEAGGNRGLCSNRMPPTLTVFSTGPYLTVAFRTDGAGPQGKGFRITVTAVSDDFRKHKSCGSNFQCDNQWCIDEDLKCDSVNHCGDNSDEAVTMGCKVQETNILSKFLSLGFTATIAISVGSIVVFIVIVATIVCCCFRCTRRPPDVNGPQSVTATAPSISSNGTSYPNKQEHVFGPMYTHQGYHPMAMQPVYPNTPSTTYSPYLHQRETFGPPSSHHSSSQAPPSYHRSYTPTSSRSAKSNRSNNSVTYNPNQEKVTFPVHV